MNSSVLQSSWMNRFPILLAPIIAGVGTLLFLLLTGQPEILLTLSLIFLVPLALFLTPSAALIHLYLTYLMFEGTFKIFSNYHPIIHVGSDILLIFVFTRLWIRHRSEGFKHLAQTRTQLYTIISFLALFWIWVLAQFFNPWGLGIVPSLAGLKVYFTPMLIFFTVAFFLKEDEIRTIPFYVLTLGLIQIAFALADWIIGPTLLANLHPRYASFLVKFMGETYRPFGTTAVPGAPSVWMYHTLVGALAVAYFLRLPKKKGKGPSQWWYVPLVCYLPLAFTVLIACQVRVILVRFVVMALIGGFFAGKRFSAALIAISIPLALLFSFQQNPEKINQQPQQEVLNRVGAAVARARSLENPETWLKAREGAWEGMKWVARYTTMGIGLSRVGASAGPWKERISADQHFGKDFSFADSLPRALFTEIGLGGLVAYALLMMVLLAQLVGTRHYLGYIVAANCFIMILAGYGSEGILYQPDASFFWLYSALAIRHRWRFHQQHGFSKTFGVCAY